MDLITLAEKLKDFTRQIREDDTLGSFSERCRDCDTKNPLFWGLVVGTMRMLTLAELGVNFVVECDSIIVFFFSQAIFWKFIPIDETNPRKIEPPRYETARAPPKRFTPIPRTEIGSCARSDTSHP